MMKIEYDIVKIESQGTYDLANMEHTELYCSSAEISDCIQTAMELTPYETYVYFNGKRIASRCIEDDPVESDNKVHPQDHREMIRQQMIDVLKKYKGVTVSAKTIWMVKRDMKQMLYQNGYHNDSSSYVEVAIVSCYVTIYHPVTGIEVSTLNN